MRQILASHPAPRLSDALAGVALGALLVSCAAPAAAQSASQGVDRYGGGNAYATPATAAQPAYPAAAGPAPAATGPAAPPAPKLPVRVLTWPGKTVPSAPQQAVASVQQQAAGYSYGPPARAPASYPAPPPAPRPTQASTAQPTAGQGYAAPQGRPAGAYAAQAHLVQAYPGPGRTAQAPTPPAYGAPAYPAQPQAQAYPQARQAPAAFAAAPSSPQPYYPPTAAARGASPAPAAPGAVYDPNTGAPQYGRPPGIPPQAPAPQPSSIYGSNNAQTPQAAAKPALAMNTATPAAPGARFYSLHRQFGLQPDPTPAPSASPGQAIELTDPLPANPVGDADQATVATRRTTTSGGKTVTTATVQSAKSADAN